MWGISSGHAYQELARLDGKTHLDYGQQLPMDWGPGLNGKRKVSGVPTLSPACLTERRCDCNVMPQSLPR